MYAARYQLPKGERRQLMDALRSKYGEKRERTDISISRRENEKTDFFLDNSKQKMCCCAGKKRVNQARKRQNKKHTLAKIFPHPEYKRKRKNWTDEHEEKHDFMQDDFLQHSLAWI